ncbi:MAG: hypothetical protein Tsb007_02120 [Rhizobacter sp.]
MWGEPADALYVILKVSAALAMEGYLLVQRMEQALAKGWRSTKTKRPHG